MPISASFRTVEFMSSALETSSFTKPISLLVTTFSNVEVPFYSNEDEKINNIAKYKRTQD